MPKKMISTAEAAAAMNIARSTFTRMVQAGKIKPAVKGQGVRGAMFFYPSEIHKAQARMEAEKSWNTSERVA